MTQTGKRAKIFFVIFLLFGGIFSAPVFADQIDKSSYGSTQESSASTNYQINSQVADPATGRVTSSNYILEHYYNFSEPYDHCANGMQDYDETGIDCGGATCPVCSGGGGGGGGIFSGTVIFSGLTSPGATVTILKDGIMVAQINANLNGFFTVNLLGLTTGNYNFSVSARDTSGLPTGAQTYAASVNAGGTLTYSNILLAPTITSDKYEVAQGEPIIFSGASAPFSTVTLLLTNTATLQEFEYTATAGIDGKYFLSVDTGSLPMGRYSVRARAQSGLVLSGYNAGPYFIVGEITIEKPEELQGTCPQKGDLNNDCRVNLVDFSIAAYWYKRPISAGFAGLEKIQLSNDGLVSLTDFSIMAYFWTG